MNSLAHEQCLLAKIANSPKSRNKLSASLGEVSSGSSQFVTKKGLGMKPYVIVTLNTLLLIM